jgi:hypothetical protein
LELLMLTGHTFYSRYNKICISFLLKIVLVVVQCIGSNGIAFFFEPFSSILSKLTAGTARGRECFEDRKRFAADKTIVTCRLSSYDFFVI